MSTQDRTFAVTVCIPAWNEESSIARTLDSVLSQTWRDVAEIIVCANGCTDSTEDVVKHYRGRWPRIRLISLPFADRATAWNTLLGATSTPIAVFVDADIRLEPKAVERLVGAFQKSPGLAIASAVPVPTSVFGIARLHRGPARPLPTDYVTGSCHAVRKTVFQKKLAKAGFAGMPEGLIADYRWLRWIAGPTGARSVTGAHAYQKVPRGSDLFAVARRSVRGNRQLATVVPKFFDGPSTGEAGIANKLLRVYRDSRTVPEFGFSLLSCGVRLFVRFVAGLQVRFDAPRTRFAIWDVAPSTKMRGRAATLPAGAGASCCV